MRCSLHPSVLLAFTSLEGDNKEDLKRGWRELKKEGDKQPAPRSGVVIQRRSSNLPVGFRGRREREAAARLPVVSRCVRFTNTLSLFSSSSSPPPPHPSTPLSDVTRLCYLAVFFSADYRPPYKYPSLSHSVPLPARLPGLSSAKLNPPPPGHFLMSERFCGSIFSSLFALHQSYCWSRGRRRQLQQQKCNSGCYITSFLNFPQEFLIPPRLLQSPTLWTNRADGM